MTWRHCRGVPAIGTETTVWGPETGLAQCHGLAGLDKLGGGTGVHLVHASHGESGASTRGGEALLEATVVRAAGRPRGVSELAEFDFGAAGERIVRRQQDAHRVDCDAVPGQLLFAGRAGPAAQSDECHVDSAFGELICQLGGRRGRVDHHLNAWVGCVQAADDAAEDGAAHRAEPAELCRSAHPGQSNGFVVQVLDRRQQRPGPNQHKVAKRGGPRTAPVALEQQPAETPLDALELCRQGGRR